VSASRDSTGGSDGGAGRDEASRGREVASDPLRPGYETLRYCPKCFYHCEEATTCSECGHGSSERISTSDLMLRLKLARFARRAYWPIVIISTAPFLVVVAFIMEDYGIPIWWPIVAAILAIGMLALPVARLMRVCRGLGLLYICHSLVCICATALPIVLIPPGWDVVLESDSEYFLWTAWIGAMLGGFAAGHALLARTLRRALEGLRMAAELAPDSRLVTWSCAATLIASPCIPFWLIHPVILLGIFVRTGRRFMPHIRAFNEVYGQNYRP
jgi:hypothetical protein